MKKEKIPEENPANRIVDQERIKAKPRDHSVTDQLNSGQKPSVTFQIDQKDGKGKRLIVVKIQKLKELKTLNQLMRKWEQEAGFGPSEAVWVCEGKPLSGEELGHSLNGKNIILRKVSKN